jgi:exopolysaccharide biosynthesis protein
MFPAAIFFSAISFLAMFRSAVWVAGMALLFNIIPIEGRAEPTDTATQWEQIAEDLELAQVQVQGNTFLSSELLFIRTKLERYRVAIIKASELGARRSSVVSLGKSAKAAAVINANFFDEQGKPLGVVISRGILNQGVHRGGGTLTGIFQAGTGGLRITNRSDFTPAGVSEAIQAGPRLLSSGSKVRGIRESSASSRRSGICIDAEQRLVLFCVSSGILGVSIEQLQDELLRPQIGCVDALNLDGGGSSQFWINPSLPGARKGFEGVSLEGTDPVPVAIALLPREPALNGE